MSAIPPLQKEAHSPSPFSSRPRYSCHLKRGPWAAIEEALLVRELVQGLGLSQHEVARRSGHDVSWVSRRLQLLAGPPDAILIAVIEGRLSSWAASANSEHAERLVKALSDAPLATRELRRWFDHYQKAGRVTRERLVDHPHLFLAARITIRALGRVDSLESWCACNPLPPTRRIDNPGKPRRACAGSGPASQGLKNNASTRGSPAL
jgi:hypothetical protein